MDVKRFLSNPQTIVHIVVWEVVVESIWAGIGKWVLKNDDGRDWGYLVAFCVALVLATIYLVARERRTGNNAPLPIIQQTIQAIVGRTFNNSTIQMDGFDYIDCVFKDCTFRWDGGRWAMHNAHTEGTRRFETRSAPVSHTIDLLKFLGLLGSTEFAGDWHALPDDYFQASP